MRCKKYEEKIILYLYGELSDKEKAELESHIRTCSLCTRDLAYTREVFKAVDRSRPEIPEANWAKCWAGIESGTAPRPREKKSFFLVPRWVFAAAAVLVIFVAGVLIGRFWFFPGQKAGLETGIARSSVELNLKEYIEDLKPVLIEYANLTPEKGGETITIDKEVARSLLVQNLLLRKIVAETNPSAAQFLEDVDLVLKEIANLKSGDRQTPSLIKELIAQRDILFKMEIFRKI